MIASPEPINSLTSNQYSIQTYNQFEFEREQFVKVNALAAPFIYNGTL